MPFNSAYYQRNHSLVKAITDHYSYSYFNGRSILDLGCGHGGIASQFHRMGAKITAVDARQSNLDELKKQFPDIQTIRADLDNEFPFTTRFDLVLSLGLLCHLKNWEKHLHDICSIAENLVLETSVLDNSDPNAFTYIGEDATMNDLSHNGTGSIVSAQNIQRVLSSFGANFKRVDKRSINAGEYIYDWREVGTNTHKHGNRRIWFVNQHKLLDRIFESNKTITQTHQTVIASSPNAQPTPPPQPAPRPANRSMMGSDRRISARERRAQNAMGILPAPSANPPSFRIQPASTMATGERRFVIVIPSYNNAQWCEKNIKSTLAQGYDKYRVIFTDDCSTDNTFEIVRGIIDTAEKKNKYTLIKNNNRKGALENLYDMIHSCDDDEIILTLDGDDWFPDGDVLSKLDKVYADKEIWLSYGQYTNFPDGGIGIATPYPEHIINGNNFRGDAWRASHLRTFYAWLFKKIHKEHLMYEGKFASMAWDIGMMTAMLEMAGHHSKFISDILYVYNLASPLNDHKINRGLQAKLDRYFRSLPKYSRCQAPEFRKPRVGLIMIATGKYDVFVQGLISSADNYFLRDVADVSYYVFTDKQLNTQSNRKINYINIEHKPFPYASMDRFKHFTNNAGNFGNEDFLFYVDVDCLFVDFVGAEILGNLTGTIHCGYYRNTDKATFETNPNSALYVDKGRYLRYYGGGFSGGRRSSYLELAKWCSEMIEKDLGNGIIPVFHDETALNRYFLDHAPDVILDPSMHFPQSNMTHYRRIWTPDNFKPKLLLLDKSHAEIRS